MKKEEEISVGGSIMATIIFAIMAVITYANDGGSATVIPVAGVVMGVVMSIMAAVKESQKSAREDEQLNFSRELQFDSKYGDGDLMLYFNDSQKTITIGSSTTSSVSQDVVNNFTKTDVKGADSFIAVLDAKEGKLLRVDGKDGVINKKVFDFASEYNKKTGKDFTTGKLSLKAYNDYAFVTDDVNGYVFIVTPIKTHFLLYSDVVSIAYEENGNDVYNKSLGGAVVGGLLFGGVGAIVGGSTAKATQNKEVSEMAIKILKRDTNDPNIRLLIYSGAVLKTKETLARNTYEELMKEVAGIKDIFSVIIDMGESKKKQEVSNTNNAAGSIADELAKLAKLKEQGILTDEEFDAQKSKLLNM